MRGTRTFGYVHTFCVSAASMLRMEFDQTRIGFSVDVVVGTCIERRAHKASQKHAMFCLWLQNCITNTFDPREFRRTAAEGRLLQSALSVKVKSAHLVKRIRLTWLKMTDYQSCPASFCIALRLDRGDRMKVSAAPMSRFCDVATGSRYFVKQRFFFLGRR